jgi:uncharacterized protein YecT (DUF1311 family)
MLRTTAVILLSVFALSGCGFFGTPNVGCNEESTKELVKKILLQEIEKQLNDPTVGFASAMFLGKVSGSVEVPHSVVLEKVSVSVDNVRSDSFDEKVNKHTCKADLGVSLPLSAVAEFSSNPIMKTFIEKQGLSITASGLQGPIQYTSQSADGGKKHYVEMLGHLPIARLVAVAAVGGAFNPQAPAPAVADAASPVTKNDNVAVSNASRDDFADAHAAEMVGPSFDCAKAGTPVEKLICATPSVSALDLKLSESYKTLLRLSEDKPGLKKEQALWIKTKRNVCETVDCLQSAYQSRLDELEASIQHLSKPAEFR